MYSQKELALLTQAASLYIDTLNDENKQELKNGVLYFSDFGQDDFVQAFMEKNGIDFFPADYTEKAADLYTETFFPMLCREMDKRNITYTLADCYQYCVA
jgi:hypothetical protein